MKGGKETREQASQMGLMESVGLTEDVVEYPARASEGKQSTDHMIQQGAYGRIM